MDVIEKQQIRPILLDTIAYAPMLEKPNLTNTRSRPGEKLLSCWSRGRPATHDVQ